MNRLSLRGLGWGLLALVVVAVVLFAAVLGVNGQRHDAAAPAPDPVRTTAATPPVGPDGPPLVGGWTFDENAGPSAAAVAGDNPMTLHQGAAWVPDGRSGSAVHFDGVEDYAETTGPAVDTAGSYTVSVWVRLDRIPGSFATAVSQDGDVDSGFFLQYSGADRRWAMAALNPGGVGVRALSGQEPLPGRWTHLTGVRDVAGGRLVLYVDGVQQSSAVYDQHPASGGPFVVGRAEFGGRMVDFLPGAVDGLRVYAGVLTPEEIKAVYESGR